ncbi:MAG: TIM barrel protein [Candidatus Diapherotrites archaeon]
MKSLLFATAGIPLSTPKPGTIEGIKRVRALGLDAMELEFVQNVNVSRELAPEVKKTAEQNSVLLTCHGSYYINLNSSEKEKRNASKKRVLDGAKRAWECGAQSIAFHAAFYQKNSQKEVFETVKKALQEIVLELKAEGNKIWVRPETTGKASQFGTIEEIIALASEIEQVMPCIDFSHLHARSNGKMNTYAEFASVLEKMEKGLGKSALKELHCHVSGIAYSEKGERNHLDLKESDFNYKDLLKAFKDFDCSGIIVCESPSIEGDALILKKAFSSL